MSSRIFGDSTSPQNIPLDQVQGFWAYCDGDFATSEPELARFRDARKAIAFISVHGDWAQASCLDVENGAATVDDAPLFIKNRDRIKPAGNAAIYCNLATLPEIEAKCAGLDYWRFVASWSPAVPHIPRHENGSPIRKLLAVQYVNHPGYDLSEVLKAHIHPDPA